MGTHWRGKHVGSVHVRKVELGYHLGNVAVADTTCLTPFLRNHRRWALIAPKAHSLFQAVDFRKCLRLAPLDLYLVQALGAHRVPGPSLTSSPHEKSPPPS
mmetsp:Transcript_6310/g.23289  ORF Transcript_6310/g.23289 Transcript_6310/m.23289 type:complete len:101 (+) Transcript_6310:1122-1424(+)